MGLAMGFGGFLIRVAVVSGGCGWFPVDVAGFSGCDCELREGEDFGFVILVGCFFFFCLLVVMRLWVWICDFGSWGLWLWEVVVVAVVVVEAAGCCFFFFGLVVVASCGCGYGCGFVRG